AVGTRHHPRDDVRRRADLGSKPGRHDEGEHDGDGEGAHQPRLARRVVHPTELDRATTPSLEADDHEQLLPVLGAEVVLRDLPPPLPRTLHHDLVPWPWRFDL